MTGAAAVFVAEVLLTRGLYTLCTFQVAFIDGLL